MDGWVGFYCNPLNTEKLHVALDTAGGFWGVRHAVETADRIGIGMVGGVTALIFQDVVLQNLSIGLGGKLHVHAR